VKAGVIVFEDDESGHAVAPGRKGRREIRADWGKLEKLEGRSHGRPTRASLRQA
jgi:hypothetical protein